MNSPASQAPAGATVPTVAPARIGMRAPSLYEYFSDKEDILVCLVEEELPLP